jgi:hypothetical protein
LSSAVSLALEQPSAVTSRSRRGFRLIPRFETDPQVIAFAQTIPGKLVLLTVFGLCLSMVASQWQLKLALVSCTTFFPQARRLIVTVGTLLLTDFFWFERGNLGMAAAHSAAQFSRISEFFWIILPFALLCAGLMWLATKYPSSTIGHHPVFVLMGVCVILVTVACYAPLTGFARFAVWAFLDTFCIYIWFLAYAMADCATARGDGLFLQAGTFHPFWGSSHVPLPKGASHWRKIEAKNSEDLAVTMVKGVKLIAWCLLLMFVQSSYLHRVHERLAIPSTGDCIRAFQAGKPLAWGRNWLSWPDDLMQELMSISIWGHAMIATCRMAGFRALRNTYAPLSSRTIAEYWNRYYFYFKELLVDMFFYPTFIRCFKKRPKLRLFFATFVAASLGNTLFHLTRTLDSALFFGAVTIITTFRSYLFYSLLLALGIGLSQIRSRTLLGSRGWFREKVLSPVCVLSFYCFVHVFELTTPIAGFRYLEFLLTRR